MHTELRSWLVEIRSSKLVSVGCVEDFVRENMFAFSMAAEVARKIDVGEVDLFLEAAYREYALKLASAPAPMLFYAWHDEQAGQLRVCAVPANRPEDLPFGCRIDVRETPSPVSSDFLGSGYLDGIPWAEFMECAFDEEVVAPMGFVLTVFVRPLPFQIDGGEGG